MCTVPDCSRLIYAHGLCNAHYKRWLIHGDVRADIPIRSRSCMKHDADAKCTVPDCNLPVLARGLCSLHYRRWQRRWQTHGDVRADIPIRRKYDANAKCTVPDCGRPVHTRGFCRAHYERWLIHGDVQADIPIKGSGSIIKCTVPDCGRPARGHRLCKAHCDRQRRYGDVRAKIPIRPRSAWEIHNLMKYDADTKCTVSNCGLPVQARGFCYNHYNHWYRHGGQLEMIEERAMAWMEAHPEAMRECPL
jgi:hypothetical protein